MMVRPCFSGFVASTLVAAAAAGSDWSFLVMGDWGGSETSPYSTPEEISTAAGMEAIAAAGIPGTAASAPKFSLALGDNFYSHGIGGDCHDPRFINTFEKVYKGEHLQAPDFTFHVVAGNHDHLGNVSAQIAYSDLSKRWSFPTEYYSFIEQGPDPGASSVEIVLIDTVILTGVSNILDDNQTLVGELKGSELPGPADQAKADAQMAWLEATLAKSTADYLIVAGHYPIYSICEHGPTSNLIANVKPLLEHYNVTAYLAGHDHCMEYLKETGSELDHHGIGSAHENNPSQVHASAVPKDSLKWHNAGKGGGFATFQVSNSGLTVRHHDSDGIVFTAPVHSIRPTGPYPPYVPKPPGPAPPPAPPVPVPTGMTWECHNGMRLPSSAVAKFKLQDDDLKYIGASVSDCENQCNGMNSEGCSAIYWHFADSHCHALVSDSGSFPDHATFVSALSSSANHTTCILVQSK